MKWKSLIVDPNMRFTHGKRYASITNSSYLMRATLILTLFNRYLPLFYDSELCDFEFLNVGSTSYFFSRVSNPSRR